MTLHKLYNRLIQALTLPDSIKAAREVTLWVPLSKILLFSCRGKGDATQTLRAGTTVEEIPKPLRLGIRSGDCLSSVMCRAGRYARLRIRYHFRFIRRSLKCFALVVISLSAIANIISCGGSSSSSKSQSTVTVNITPTTAIVGLGGTVQFTCLESGNANTNVTWEVDDVVGGDATVGTISRNGLYTAPSKFTTPSTVTVTCVAQANSTSTANVPVTLSSGVTVAVSPASIDLSTGQSQQFTAAVNGSSNTAVTWEAGGVQGGNPTYGTISSSGLYTAPTSLATTPLAITVSAVAQVDTAKSGTASVTVHSAIAVAVTPNPVTVATFGSQQFTAAVTGTTSTGVTWEVNGIVGGSSATGTISNTGLYSAPNSVPTSASNGKGVATTVTVTAVSQADSTAKGNVAVTIQPRNQAAQKTPIALGASGSNAADLGISSQCCGGTLGALVSRGGNQYLLSASHVLARTDTGNVGDAIIQPGLDDAGCSTANTNSIANLMQFISLENPPATTPFVDAALAQVIADQVDPLGTILELGATTQNGQPSDAPPHQGTGVAPSLGLAVAKSGRSTGLTCSSITAINAVVNVQYQKGCATGPSFLSTFKDLVVIADTSFSADGDSGSLIVSQAGADPVALLVASSDTDTLAAPVADVLTALADPGTGQQPVFVGTAATHIVAGCSLPGSPSVSPIAAAQLKTRPTAEVLQAANTALYAHAATLLADQEVRAVGVAASLDDPGHAAILLVMAKTSLVIPPTDIAGYRTRIVQSDDIPHQGVLSATESESIAEAAQSSNGAHGLSNAQIAITRKILWAHTSELLHKEGVQGVAITVSADNPNQPALLVLRTHGRTQETIPLSIDGVRTRIQETSAFRAGSQSTEAGAGCKFVSSKKNRR